jgi:diguanylate cyclase (GGDEF)-like protein/PAS domain S-box-containing protein
LIELDRERLTSIVEMAEDAGQVGHWLLHVDEDAFSWSPQVFRTYGRRTGSQTRIARSDMLAAFHADDRGMVNECLRAAVEHREEFQMDARIVRNDGSIRFVKIAGRPQQGRSEPVRDVLGIIMDITEFKRTEHKLRRLAETDPLTGAVNVRRFESIAMAELRRTSRFGSEATLVIIDIDGFKGINDSFGHLVGDDVLRAFVKMMTHTLREVDVVARIGGDEFAILMPETSLDEAKKPLERIDQLSRSLRIERENLTICLTFSAGLSPMTPDTNLRDILRSADTMLYEAKRTGTGRVETFTPDSRKRLSS